MSKKSSPSKSSSSSSSGSRKVDNFGNKYSHSSSDKDSGFSSSCYETDAYGQSSLTFGSLLEFHSDNTGHNKGSSKHRSQTSKKESKSTKPSETANAGASIHTSTSSVASTHKSPTSSHSKRSSKQSDTDSTQGSKTSPMYIATDSRTSDRPVSCRSSKTSSEGCRPQTSRASKPNKTPSSGSESSRDSGSLPLYTASNHTSSKGYRPQSSRASKSNKSGSESSQVSETSSVSRNPSSKDADSSCYQHEEYSPRLTASQTSISKSTRGISHVKSGILSDTHSSRKSNSRKTIVPSPNLTETSKQVPSESADNEATPGRKSVEAHTDSFINEPVDEYKSRRKTTDPSIHQQIESSPQDRRQGKKDWSLKEQDNTEHVKKQTVLKQSRKASDANYDEDRDETPTRVYANNSRSRALLRVGQPLGTKVYHEKTGTVSEELYKNTTLNRHEGRVGLPRGSRPIRRTEHTQNVIKYINQLKNNEKVWHKLRFTKSVY